MKYDHCFHERTLPPPVVSSLISAVYDRCRSSFLYLMSNQMTLTKYQVKFFIDSTNRVLCKLFDNALGTKQTYKLWIKWFSMFAFGSSDMEIQSRRSEISFHIYMSKTTNCWSWTHNFSLLFFIDSLLKICNHIHSMFIHINDEFLTKSKKIMYRCQPVVSFFYMFQCLGWFPISISVWKHSPFIHPYVSYVECTHSTLLVIYAMQSHVTQ